MNQDKPSYKTLEFWLSFAAMLLGAFMASGIMPSDGEAMKIIGFIVTALSAMGYTTARTFQKSTAAKLTTNLAAINAAAPEKKV